MSAIKQPVNGAGPSARASALQASAALKQVTYLLSVLSDLRQCSGRCAVARSEFVCVCVSSCHVVCGVVLVVCLCA